MKRILVYEFTLAGLPWNQENPYDDLRAEGNAMVRALAEDIGRIHGHTTLVLAAATGGVDGIPRCEVRQVRSPRNEREMLCEAAAAADGTVLIAPETDGILAERARWVESAGGRLLSPSSIFIEAAANKQRLAQRLRESGIPTTRGLAWTQGQPFPQELPYPWVVKPIQGAGAMDSWRCDDWRQAERMQSRWPSPARIETVVPGTAVSVAFLCGPSGCQPLRPCGQRIEMGSQVRYLGGWTPLQNNLCERAVFWGAQAIAQLPAPRGYLGVDLVLGEEADGGRDAVIEINSRLTTSYIGLRQRARGNIAEWMLRVLEGERCDIDFEPEPIEFFPDGTVNQNLNRSTP